MTGRIASRPDGTFTDPNGYALLDYTGRPSAGCQDAEGENRGCRVRRDRDDHEDRPGGHATGRATPGYGYVVRAGDSAVVRECAHGPERQANAGFSLIVGFENPDGSAYVPLARPRASPGAVSGRRDRVGGAERRAHRATERAGSMNGDESGFLTPSARRTISPSRTARWMATA